MLFRSEEIDRFNPDCLLVFKGAEILPRSILYANQKKILTANYNPDNPFIFISYGNGKRNISKTITTYRCHFTYNLETAKILKKINPNTFVIPFGVNSTATENDILPEHAEKLKVCFYGGPDKKRYEFLNLLAAHGIDIDLYGNGWKNKNLHDRISLFPEVTGENLGHLIRSYRIQLNILSLHNEQSHNMRSFEIPAHFGIQLAPKTVEHEDFFQNEVSIFLYDSLEDAVKIITRLSNLSYHDAIVLRRNSYIAAVKHSYKNRISNFSDILINLRNNDQLETT